MIEFYCLILKYKIVLFTSYYLFFQAYQSSTQDVRLDPSTTTSTTNASQPNQQPQQPQNSSPPKPDVSPKVGEEEGIEANEEQHKASSRAGEIEAAASTQIDNQLGLRDRDNEIDNVEVTHTNSTNNEDVTDTGNSGHQEIQRHQ